jgi:hypothetical protein
MKRLFALSLILAGPLASLAADAAPDPPTPVRRFQAMAGIDGAGWALRYETPTLILWQTPEGTTVQLEVADRHPVRDTYLVDQVAAQDFFRSTARRHSGALVEVLLHRDDHGTPYDVATMKYKADASDGKAAGVRSIYTLSIWFVLPDNVDIIKIAASEKTPAGAREAAVGDALAKANAGHRSEMAQHDPYDARFDATALYVESDARRWDGLVPTNPLSQIRALEKQLLEKSKLPGVAESVAAAPSATQ